jgi:hypothetical protein
LCATKNDNKKTLFEKVKVNFFSQVDARHIRQTHTTSTYAPAFTISRKAPLPLMPTTVALNQA